MIWPTCLVFTASWASAVAGQGAFCWRWYQSQSKGWWTCRTGLWWVDLYCYHPQWCMFTYGYFPPQFQLSVRPSRNPWLPTTRSVSMTFQKCRRIYDFKCNVIKCSVIVDGLSNMLRRKSLIKTLDQFVFKMTYSLRLDHLIIKWYLKCTIVLNLSAIA